MQIQDKINSLLYRFHKAAAFGRTLSKSKIYNHATEPGCGIEPVFECIETGNTKIDSPKTNSEKVKYDVVNSFGKLMDIVGAGTVSFDEGEDN